MRFILLTIIFIFNITHTAQAKIDKSSDVFFPPHQAKIFKMYQELPLSWWNFLFFHKDTSKDEICEKVARLDKSLFLFNPCLEQPFHKDWLNQISLENTLSSPPPKKQSELKDLLDKALVQLSLPLPATLLESLRENPMSQLDKLMEDFSNFYKPPTNNSTWENLPFLFRFPPQDIKKTKIISQLFSEPSDIHWIGPYFGAIENQEQIITDLEKVSLIAILGLLALFLTFYFLHLRTYLLLVPLLGISIGIATLIVHMFFGSIHGLTIAFGSGLIGISMDYAFHGWRKIHKAYVWRSNFIGFLTSFGAFILLSFFSIPLIKQLSLFSCIGLSTSFILCYTVSRHLPLRYRPQTLNLKLPSFQPKVTLVLGGSLVLIGGLSFLFSKTDFSLERMDYSRSKLANSNLSKNLTNFKNEYAFVFTQKNNQEMLLETKDILNKKNISFLSPYSFLSPQDNTGLQIKQWTSFVCTDQYKTWHLKEQAPYKNLFAPFFNTYNCENFKSLKTADLNTATKLFSSNDKIVGIAKITDPQSIENLKKISQPYFLITDITKKFPIRLKSEITNFSILIVLFILVILCSFFRNKAPFALIPAIGAISSVFLGLFLLGTPLSFMSFVSIIILLGLSLDYGIFCTSYLLKNESLSSVYGSIAMSSTTSIIGFAPLCFCKHPVLFDIGVTITLGLAGSTLMTLLIFPMLEKKGVRV